MVKLGGRLSALKVTHARESGMLADGNGLYLQVTRANARSWIFRYYRNGKSHEMGLGSLNAVGLADARLKAAECRRLLAGGIDPIAARDAENAQRAMEDARAITFDQCAEAFIASHSAAWKNQKHVAQWKATLRTYASPVFGSLSVQAVDVRLVMKVLDPIWATKPETATRIRGRIESVLNWAKARGYRTGENPALWKGHLDKLLPPRSKIAKVRHHAALPYDRITQFIDMLRQQNGVAARALEFAILTAARTGEVIGARWDEIDLPAKLWTVPAARMKGGREHRVPLSVAALAVLNKVRKGVAEDFVFAGRNKSPLSNMAFLMLLRRMEYTELTAHGFRSTFRDWAAECSNFPGEVAEMALAHAVGNKVEAAYRRGDMFEKRRLLMAEWAKYCIGGKSAATVVSIVSAQR
jgi:integrase